MLKKKSKHRIPEEEKKTPPKKPNHVGNARLTSFLSCN